MTKTPLSELLRLDEKIAIVTGGAKGIGRGIAERLAEAGAHVIIADIDEAAGGETARRIGGEFLVADMTAEEDLQRIVVRAEENGGPDILVNNAGIFPFKPALEMSAEEWDRVQAVNLRGLFLLSREFAKSAARRKAGGSIVNIGSID